METKSRQMNISLNEDEFKILTQFNYFYLANPSLWSNNLVTVSHKDVIALKCENCDLTKSLNPNK